jgi:hypothetical protein
MDAFAPVINLLVLLSALSVAAERLANAIKLRDPELRKKRSGSGEEKDREQRIALRALLVSVLLAVALKADFFQIVSHLHAPWETLGWAGYAEASTGRMVQAIGGMVVTGVALGFGSKFWHDVLDIVYGARDSVRTTSAAQRIGASKIEP